MRIRFNTFDQGCSYLAQWLPNVCSPNASDNEHDMHLGVNCQVQTYFTSVLQATKQTYFSFFKESVPIQQSDFSYGSDNFKDGSIYQSDR